MKILVTIFGLILMANGCEKNSDDSGQTGSYVSLSLNINDQQQKIQSFGASDAWSTQFVGKNWPEDKKLAISELLFSTELNTDGNPKGIGLSGWRFNIGAGSAEQGSGSQISDEWRRAESFLLEDGTFNWTKQQGQMWFLKEATIHNVHHLTAFANSPPVHYTKNGYAWSSGGNSANLQADKYDDYANYLATILAELKQRENLSFDFISPVNEPQWDWDNKGQEGTPFINSEIASVTRLLSKELISSGLETNIELADAAHIAYIYEYSDKPERGNQAYEFFAAESENYVGDLPNVAEKISGHSYYSTYPVSTMLSERRNVWNGVQAVSPTLEFWQSEYCILEGNDEINGNGRDLGIDPAMYLARLMHFDLTVANSSTWYWWLAISPYNYKDGLIYIDYNKNDGKYYDSKLMWVMGNYSRFVRPGMNRYSIIRSDNQSDEHTATGLMASGYANSDLNQVVFVLVNYSNTVTYPVKVKTIDNRIPSSIKMYTTSARNDDNLKMSTIQSIDDIISIIPRSVSTVVMEF